MFRRLIAFVRFCTDGLRAAGQTLRGWMAEWLYVLTTPIRAFRPRNWLGLVAHGVMEVLLMLRLARPRGFRAEMVGGGWDAVGVVRMIVGGTVTTAVAFFWFLVWLPRFLAQVAYHGPIQIWYFLRTRTRW